jgi:Mg-chelatase subunit ChlI
VLWSYFVLSPAKIIDEFNRLPASKQNILLDGIDRGNWKYLSELVQTGDFTLFATCNYEDLGNSALIEPVLDRFDIATESKKPSLIQMATIKDISSATRRILDDREIADKIFEIYSSKETSCEEKQEQTEKISSEYRKKLEQRLGIGLLSQDELKKIRNEIDAVQFTNEAELFYTFALSELASCQQNGMKRANEQCIAGCHYADYACSKIENGLSVRSALAIAKYAKTLAWLTGENTAKATVEHIEKVLPYAIWHKTRFSEAFLASFARDERTDPIKLYAAKQLVKAIKQRFTEQMPAISNYVCLMRDGKEAEATEYVKEMDHPIFREFTMTEWR